MLKIQFKDKRQPAFWVMEKSYSIGSSKDNNLVLDDPSVSGLHARLVSNGEIFAVKAISKEAAVSVNGTRITQTNIECGDEIRIGDVDFKVIDPLEDTHVTADPYWSFIADSSWLSGQEFPIEGAENTTLTLGRGSQCNIVFAGTHLSRQHAEITINRESLTIRDLNSANGTFVNGKKITEANLKPGDQVKLDVYTFRVFGPGIDLPTSSTTQRFAAVTNSDLDQGAVTKGRKNWKTRPTSPGNREEVEHKGGKIFAWISGAVILGLFAFAAYLVLGSS